MSTIRSITFLLICGLGFFVGDAFAQGENCNKGEMGDGTAMTGASMNGASRGGSAQGQGTTGRGLSPQQTAQRRKRGQVLRLIYRVSMPY